ncbi:hypothetical protein CCMA1212_000779 [Trichoderma ghanense]|uniref:DUF3752 domain-containing protein n=1 Tax=Trichoderma ghanense TaxID=65468 RepID=A0ABY2HFN4_9HYPO
MSSIGPQLPPHLTKRRRDSDTDDTSSNKHPRRDEAPQNQDEIDLAASASGSEDDYAPPRPSSPPTITTPTASAPTKAVGPALPPHLANNDEITLDDADSDSASDTGPALPPKTTNPSLNPDSESSDSDSDDDSFGPSLPTSTTRRQIGPSLPPSLEDDAPKRDEWMLAPPPSSNTFSERDTTRIRARKFASKPSSTPSSANTAGGGPSIWTETPEEKLRRLQDSVLGRTSASSNAAQPGLSEQQQKKLQRDEALSASIHAQRGKTLLQEHQGSGRKSAGASSSRGGGGGRAAVEEEDDPSKRAFDREKDMAVGGRITATQRRELINKSANFGGRFQKGSFL